VSKTPAIICSNNNAIIYIVVRQKVAIFQSICILSRLWFGLTTLQMVGRQPSSPFVRLVKGVESVDSVESGRWVLKLGRWVARVTKLERWVAKLGRWVAKLKRWVAKLNRWVAKLGRLDG
jgi:hypothetical protein